MALPEDTLVQPSLADRLQYLTSGGVTTQMLQPQTPRDAYSSYVATRLRQAYRDDTIALLRRLEEGNHMLAAGQDPRQAGWREPANVLWEINQQGLLSEDRFMNMARLGMPSGAYSLSNLHQLLYPTARDLYPIVSLLILQTGIEVESVLGLTTECRKNPTPGRMGIEYLKRRAKGHEWKVLRFDDGDELTPGGIINVALQATARLRQHTNSKALWQYYGHGAFHERLNNQTYMLASSEIRTKSTTMTVRFSSLACNAFGKPGMRNSTA